MCFCVAFCVSLLWCFGVSELLFPNALCVPFFSSAQVPRGPKKGPSMYVMSPYLLHDFRRVFVYPFFAPARLTVYTQTSCTHACFVIHTICSCMPVIPHFYLTEIVPHSYLCFCCPSIFLLLLLPKMRHLPKMHRHRLHLMRYPPPPLFLPLLLHLPFSPPHPPSQ